MATKKAIENVQYMSAVAVRAMELYPDRMNRLIAASMGAQWVQAKLDIDGTERIVRASYRAGTVRLSNPTE